jgi:hypothetical protein
MGTLATLAGKLVMDASGYIKAMEQAEKSSQSLTERTGRQFLALGSTVNKVALGMGTAVIGAIGAASALSIREAISVESAFAGVIKTTDGLADSAGNLTEIGAELKREFRDLALEIPASVEELMRIGELGGQLGIARENLIEFSETIAMIGTATDLSLEDASMGFAQLMNIMGTPQEEVRRIGSAIVDLGNNFATTEPSILAFAHRIAGVGRIAGLSEADVLGIGTAMSSVGVEAEAGGTAVQKVLMAMTAAVSGTGQAMIDNSGAIDKTTSQLAELESQLAIAVQRQAEFTDKTKQSTRMANQARIDKLVQQIDSYRNSLGELTASHGTMVQVGAGALATFAGTAGLTVSEFQKMWQEDAAGAFNAFIRGLEKAGPQAFAILEDLGLQDQRLIRSFLSLAQGGDLLERALDSANTAWEENTALVDEARQRYATTESQIQLAKNALRDIAVTIGDALLPAFNTLIGLVTPLILRLAGELPDLLEKTLIPALDKIMLGVESVIKAFRILAGGVDVEVFWSELGTGLTTIGQAFGLSADEMQPFIDKLRDVSESIYEFVTDSLIPFVTEHWESLKSAFIAFAALLATLGIAAMIQGIAVALAGLVSVPMLVVAALALLYSAWVNDWGGIRTFIVETWENHLQPIFAVIVEWFRANIPVAMEFLREIWETVLQPALEAMGEWLGENIPKAIEWLSAAWDNVLKPALGGIWSFLSEYIIPLLAALADVWLAQVRWGFEVLAAVWTKYLQPALSSLWDFLKKVGSAIREFLAPLLAEENERKLTKIKDVFEDIKNVIKTVTDWLGRLADKFNSLSLPKWLTPGSPTPLEWGLRGISHAMGELTRVHLPDMQANLNIDDPLSGFDARRRLPDGGGSPRGVAIDRIEIVVQGARDADEAREMGRQAGIGLLGELGQRGLVTP